MAFYIDLHCHGQMRLLKYSNILFLCSTYLSLKEKVVIGFTFQIHYSSISAFASFIIFVISDSSLYLLLCKSPPLLSASKHCSYFSLKKWKVNSCFFSNVHFSVLYVTIRCKKILCTVRPRICYGIELSKDTTDNNQLLALLFWFYCTGMYHGISQG